MSHLEGGQEFSGNSCGKNEGRVEHKKEAALLVDIYRSNEAKSHKGSSALLSCSRVAQNDHDIESPEYLAALSSRCRKITRFLLVIRSTCPNNPHSFII